MIESAVNAGVKMDSLLAMKMFVRVVEVGNFSRAAESLNMPKASATRLIGSLEAHLQVRLLNRTTRRVSLTPESVEYFERCVRILSEIEEAESGLTQSRGGLRGKLRIDMPGAIAKAIVIPRLPHFHERFPDLDVVIGLGDRQIDLIQDGVDCVIRVGPLEDSSLVARRLAEFKTVTAASPDYLSRFGTPERLEDLSEHRAVHYVSSGSGKVHDMNFVVDGKHVGVKVPGKVGVNDAEAYLLCGLNGAGLIQLPRFMMYEHLRTGELIEVLHDWVPPPKLVSAVYPYNRHLSAKVRVFIDWIAEIFSSCPMLASGESADCKAVEVPAIRFPRSTPVVVDHAAATEVPLALS